MRRYSYILVIALAAIFVAPPAAGQSFLNQEALEEVLSRRAESLDALPEVYYEYYIFDHPRENTVLARAMLYKRIGQGDVERGKDRAKLLELLNRRLMINLEIGDTLVVPTEYDLDLRAYSPFPRYYPGARHFDKLFVMDKTVQAFAAYEYGQLVRWGVINTGAQETPTPNGRYNFNWKEEYRVSTLSPPGEPWEMYWVFNIHDARGIHVHQYAFPTGGPTSHGCVRLVDADAEWIYNWADAWRTTTGGENLASRTGRIIEPGTTVLVIGEDPEGTPQPFEFRKRYPILKRLDLPAHPYDVPAGTDQQRYFDRLRLASQ